MRLETKFQDKDFDFGEIVKAKVTTYYDENKVVVMADKSRGGISRFEYNSIKDFTDHWEDAPEEPEEFYIVEQRGTVGSRFRTGAEYEEKFKAIGNYFETKEEAEKAAEKLKAWKRLKDKGFRFKYWTYKMDEPKIENHTHFMIVGVCEDGVRFDDLDLLFGGEE